MLWILLIKALRDLNKVVCFDIFRDLILYDLSVICELLAGCLPLVALCRFQNASLDAAYWSYCLP